MEGNPYLEVHEKSLELLETLKETENEQEKRVSIATYIQNLDTAECLYVPNFENGKFNVSGDNMSDDS